MRNYAQLQPTFWTGDTGRRLRAAGANCQVLALYLMSAPSANMIGLYYIPLPTISHETGLSVEAAAAGIRHLGEIGFADYDEATETVWVREMARFQVGEDLKPADKRVKGVAKDLHTYRKSRFYPSFIERYGSVFYLGNPSEGASKPLQSPSEGASKPLRSPSEAPSKPLRSQEQEQEQEQEHEQEVPPSRADACEAAGKQPPTDPAPDVTDAERDAAYRAFDEWAATKAPIGRGFPLQPEQNETRKVATLLGVLAQETPVIHGGQQVPQHRVVPLVVEQLRKSARPFKNPDYAAAAARSRLAEWAASGHPPNEIKPAVAGRIGSATQGVIQQQARSGDVMKGLDDVIKSMKPKGGRR